MARVAKRLMIVLALTLSFAVSTSFPAAAKGNPHQGPSAAGSLTLVLLGTTVDGLPHWGNQVTFTVSTTATTEPDVSLKCFQSGVLVYGAQTGYYASYPWPWTQVMTLSSGAWTSGGANCTAELYYFSGTKVVSLGTISVTVYP